MPCAFIYEFYAKATDCECGFPVLRAASIGPQEAHSGSGQGQSLGYCDELSQDQLTESQPDGSHETPENGFEARSWPCSRIQRVGSERSLVSSCCKSFGES